MSFALAAAAVLMLSGKLVYSSPLYSRAENWYHVPREVVDLCDAIEVEGREVMAVFPDELLLYVRQYSPVVCMPYGRDALTGTYNELHQLLQEQEIEAAELARLAKAEWCHYVILSQEKELLGDMAAYDYEVFGRMHGYVIYVDNSFYRGL